MTVEAINQGKIKIILSAFECIKYSIKASSDDSKAKTAKKYWRIILDAAEDLLGIASSERLLIQVLILDSGAEILATRLSKSCDIPERSSTKFQFTYILSLRCAIYPFFSISELFDSVQRFDSDEWHNSALYYTEDGVYYLFLEERSMLGAYSKLSVMNEFSKPLPPLLNSYVLEHAIEIIKNDAIGTLKLIVNKR